MSDLFLTSVLGLLIWNGGTTALVVQARDAGSREVPKLLPIPMLPFPSFSRTLGNLSQGGHPVAHKDRARQGRGRASEDLGWWWQERLENPWWEREGIWSKCGSSPCGPVLLALILRGPGAKQLWWELSLAVLSRQAARDRNYWSTFPSRPCKDQRASVRAPSRPQSVGHRIDDLLGYIVD